MSPPDHPTHSASRERQALLAGLSAVLLWSSVATGFKLSLTELTALQLVLLGSTISTLIFAIAAALAPATSKAPNTAPPGNLITLLKEAAPLALINPLLYYPVVLAGYDRLPAQIAQPLNYTWAVVLALLAVPLLKQPLSARLLWGIAVSYAGAVIVVVGGQRAAWTNLDLQGLFYIALSTVLWALYWVLNTRTRSAPLTLMLASFSLALPPLALVTWWLDGWPPLTATSLGYGLWIGAVEMGITFLLWQRALRLTRAAARIGQLIFLAPFLGLIPIHLVLGEPILWTSVAGLVIIIGGLLLTRQTTG